MMFALGLSNAEIEGHLKEKPSELLCGKTPRWAMQSIGTEWGRNLIGGEIWVNAWKRAIEGYPLVVVDDVRFPNEAQAIKDAGGLLLRVIRPDQDNGGNLVHASEVQDFVVHATVYNRGSLSDLDKLVDELAQQQLADRRKNFERYRLEGRPLNTTAVMHGEDCIGLLHSEALAQQIVDDLN